MKSPAGQLTESARGDTNNKAYGLDRLSPQVYQYNLSQISPKKSEKSLIEIGEYNELERDKIMKQLEEKEHLTNTQRIRDALNNDNYKSEQTKEENMGDLGDNENDHGSEKNSYDDSGKKSLEFIGQVVTVDDEKQ